MDACSYVRSAVCPAMHSRFRPGIAFIFALAGWSSGGVCHAAIGGIDAFICRVYSRVVPRAIIGASCVGREMDASPQPFFRELAPCQGPWHGATFGFMRPLSFQTPVVSDPLAMSAEPGPKSARSRRNVLDFGPDSANIWPSSTKFGLMSAKPGPDPVKVRQLRSNLDQMLEPPRV